MAARPRTRVGGGRRVAPGLAAGHTHEHAETAVAETAKEIATVEQKTCPVMEGNPINTKYFAEYKGKKVYFCCPGCDTKFNADPEKYLSKLPQFNQ